MGQVLTISANGRVLIAETNVGGMRTLLEVYDISAVDDLITNVNGTVDSLASQVAALPTVSFSTIKPQMNASDGTSVVADSASDTLTLNFDHGANVTGNASTDTLTLCILGHQQSLYNFDGTGYITSIGTSYQNAVTLAANRLYKSPILIARKRTITEVALVVTTGDASSVRMGIRNCNIATGEPTTLVADCGTVSVSSTGVKSITGLSISLDPGIYYLEMVSDGTASVRGLTASTCIGRLGVSLPGTTSALGITGLYRSFTYGSLPSDATGVTQTLNTANCPIFFIK